MGDPISLIMTALVAGAAKTAVDAVQDAAYKGLKKLIKRKFEGKPEAEIALAKHDEKPEVWKEPLKDELVKAGADKDQEILAAAKKVMEKEDPEGASSGKYDFRGAQGVQVGNHGTQTNTFK